MHHIIVFIFVFLLTLEAFPQKKDFKIIAYYSRGPEQVESLPAEKLSHIIFSFCHLKGNKLTVDDGKDSLTIRNLVGLKKRNPSLKIILSLGGWGGCPTCSDVFATAAGRKEFSESVLALFQYFSADGIDLDWEYPTIEGYPGHKYVAADKANFTALAQQLRRTVGKNYEISFAAGGFQKFLDESVDWKAVMKHMDHVNIMSYDLINGYSTTTGHHTALYSNSNQNESTDNAIQYLVKLGIPRNKIVIGAAFYARVWENVEETNNGLYQPGKFKTSVPYKNFPERLSGENGFTLYWDDQTKAPYAYSASQKEFATFDDKRSLEHKTKYALEQQLKGIMFWELSQDVGDDGLVDAIFRTAKGK